MIIPSTLTDDHTFQTDGYTTLTDDYTTLTDDYTVLSEHRCLTDVSRTPLHPHTVCVGGGKKTNYKLSTTDIGC